MNKKTRTYKAVDVSKNPKKIKPDSDDKNVVVRISDKLTIYVKEGTDVNEIIRKYKKYRFEDDTNF